MISLFKQYRIVVFAISLFLVLGISFYGCTKNEIEEEIIPVADFNYSNAEVFVGETVTFINATLNTNSSTSFFWDFGDGNTSSKENPSYVYQTPGTYIVSLTVENHGTAPVQKAKEIMVSLRDNIQGRIKLRERLANLKKEILVCAHRGNHSNMPENSIAAISESIKEEIAIVEIDIRQTKDGKLVLMHDKTIDRTSNGSGNVNDFTLAELKQFNLEHDGKLTSQLIPSLAEVLEMARGKIYLDMDVKIENFIKVYNEVKMYGMVGQVMFTVDDVTIAKSLVSNNPQVVVMPIIRTQDDFDLYTNSNLNLSVVHYNSSSFTTNLIDQAHKQNLKVFRSVYINSSTTPDSDSYKQIDNLIRLEGNIVQTDYPVEVKLYLKSKN